jgi:hypothetical protein
LSQRQSKSQRPKAVLNEPLDPFFADFAVPATLKQGTPPEDAETDLLCIFDKDYQPLGLVAAGAEGRSITALCRSADVASAKHGDTFVVDGQAYPIIEIQPASEGAGDTLTELVLRE